MLKGWCKKYRKTIADGKVIHYCFRIKCCHLKLYSKEGKNGKSKTFHRAGKDKRRKSQKNAGRNGYSPRDYTLTAISPSIAENAKIARSLLSGRVV